MMDRPELHIRPAVIDDLVIVTDLLRDLGLALPSNDDPERVKDYWLRLWDRNPYYAEFDEPVFYGWVLMHQESIVGFFGSIPRVYYLDKIKIPVSTASSWGVIKKYRMFTGMLCDAYFLQNPMDFKLVTTAIKPTGKIFEKYDGKRVPDASLDNVYMIPFNIVSLICLKLKGKSFFNITMFKKLACLLPLWKIQYRFKQDKCLQEVDMDALPEEYDFFWEEYLAQTKGLIASRDAAALKWVYGQGRSEVRKIVFIYRSETDNRVLGYAALVDEPILNDKEFKRYKLADLLALTPGVKKAMLKALLRYACNANADLLEIHLPNTIGKEEIPAFTLQRKVPSFPVYFHSSKETLNALLEQKESWHISPYDGDTTLG